MTATFQCPKCGHRIRTPSTVAGAFNLPPNLYCVHAEGDIEMEIV